MAAVPQPVKPIETLLRWPVYLIAAATPLSIALTSVAKALLFLTAAALLVCTMALNRKQVLVRQMGTTHVVLLMVGAMALSLLYTSAPLPAALVDLAKCAKLLMVVLIPLLLRSRRAAVTALGCYLVAQAFVLFSSYLLAFGFHPPWVWKTVRSSVAVVFSGQLDQSLMTAGFAVLCWHLRRQFPGWYGPPLAVVLAALGTLNVLFLLPARSGQAALVAAMCVTLFRALRGWARVAALVVPALVVAFAMLASPMVRERLLEVRTETQAYSRGDATPTSSGLRLNYWHRALQSIAENPVVGSGVGSWPYEFERLDHSPSTARNPHQEFLLWGVQLGLVGIGLLGLFFFSALRDSRGFAAPARDATASFVAVMFVACLFNSALFDGLIGDYFCVLLGLLMALGFCRE